MLVTGINGEVESLVIVGYTMEGLILRAQLTEDMLGLLGRRLRDVDLLETAHEAFRTREVTIVFLVGGGADKADGARLKIGFQHVGGVHRALACSTCSHQRVDLVDIDDVLVALFLNAIHDLLDAMFEVTTILCASEECADVELIDAAALQPFGYPPLFNHPCQAPDEGCLAHTRLAHMQGVVLVATTEYLDGAMQLLFTANERVVVLVELVHAGDEASPGGIGLPFARPLCQVVVVFTEADELAHEFTFLVGKGFLEQITGPRLFQTEQAHDEMGHVHRLCTAAEDLLTRDLYQLPHLLGGLWFVLTVFRHRLDVFQLVFQSFGQHLRRIEYLQGLVEVIVVDEDEQQVLRHDELMSVFPAALHGVV